MFFIIKFSELDRKYNNKKRCNLFEKLNTKNYVNVNSFLKEYQISKFIDQKLSYQFTSICLNSHQHRYKVQTIYLNDIK